MLRSAGARFLIVGLLALFMFIPLFFVGEVIGNRADYSRQTVDSVGAEWGGPQVVTGPRLVLPLEGPQTRTETRELRDPVTGETRVEAVELREVARRGAIHVYPRRFEAALDTVTQVRRRGIFEVPVFTAVADFSFDFDFSGVPGLLREGERVVWDAAVLDVGLSSNRALRGASGLRSALGDLPFEPRAGGGGIAAAPGDPRALGDMEFQLEFNGAQMLMIAPVGRSSEITMTGDWPHPSFSGAFLPGHSEVGSDGFTARWSIPHLARGLPQQSREDTEALARDEAMGLRFFQPNDFYQKAYRAARHGILFIALTFLSVLLIEGGRGGAPAHPVQYILIGLAQSLFVLLMVAYAEQIGFAPAYALSAGATILLLVMFGAWGLKLGRGTLILGLMLAVLYGVLYLILESADYALIAGSTLAFGALAGTMYATRHEDWYGGEGKGRGWRLFAGSGPEGPDAPPDGGQGQQADAIATDARPLQGDDPQTGDRR